MHTPPPTESAAAALRLSLVNDMPSLETARLAMREHLAQQTGLRVSARALYRLELVLEEALMNRIWHAYPQGGSHCIGFELQTEPGAVHLRFSDDGVAFDPLKHPVAARPASLEAARPGGLGLLLTRQAVSAAHWERRDGRNLLTLSVALD